MKNRTTNDDWSTRYGWITEGDPEATEGEEEGQTATLREASGSGHVRVRECAGEETEGDEETLVRLVSRLTVWHVRDPAVIAGRAPKHGWAH